MSSFKLIANNELEIVWNEAVVAIFEVLNLKLHTGRKDSHKNLQSLSRI